MVVLISSITVQHVSAHPGGLDAFGGHIDHRTGVYHVHRPGDGGMSGNPMGFGFGSFGQSDYQPSPRRRARSTAKTTARTTARSEAPREPAVNVYVSPQDDMIKTGNGNSKAATIVIRADRDDENAQELLRLAKVLIKQGKIPGALNYLRELNAKYPDTKAGKEGAVLLKQLETD